MAASQSSASCLMVGEGSKARRRASLNKRAFAPFTWRPSASAAAPAWAEAMESGQPLDEAPGHFKCRPALANRGEGIGVITGIGAGQQFRKILRKPLPERQPWVALRPEPQLASEHFVRGSPEVRALQPGAGIETHQLCVWRQHIF